MMWAVVYGKRVVAQHGYQMPKSEQLVQTRKYISEGILSLRKETVI